MRKNIIIFGLLLGFSVLISCHKDSIEPTPVNIFGFDDYDEATANLGGYIHIFAVTEGAIIMRKTESLFSGSTQWDVGAFFREEVSADTGDGGDYYINDSKFVHNGNFYSLNGLASMDNEANGTFSDQLYGNSNSFRLERNGADVFETEFYVPASIQISNLSPQGNVLPIDRNDNLNVEWNADLTNENGVVFYLSYNGVNMSDNTTNEAIDRAVKVPDTGSTTLDKALFEGLPPDASFTLWAIRGNAQLIEATDSRSYSVSSRTEQKIYCRITE